MAEKAIVNRILREIRAHGGFCEKTHGNEMTRTGMPDVVGCIGGMYVAIEVKERGKKPTAAQARVLSEIRAAGGIGAWTDSAERVTVALENWPRVCRACLRTLEPRNGTSPITYDCPARCGWVASMDYLWHDGEADG